MVWPFFSLGISQRESQGVGKFYASGSDENEAYEASIINVTRFSLRCAPAGWISAFVFVTSLQLKGES
ncbi:MAG: hypothetical protein ACJAS5_001045 [Lentimonas sp.]